MDRWSEGVKKLVKVIRHLNELAVEIISLTGWILILIEVLK